MFGTPNFYLNFFSLGSLIPATITMVAAVFLLLIPNKKPSSKRFTWFFCLISLFNFCYFPASAFFEPLGAYHRWGTVLLILSSGVIVCQFLLYYPERTHPRLDRVFLVGMSVISVLLAGYFMASTWNAPRIYHFDGHYWDFDAGPANRVIGLAVFAYILLLGFVGFWKSYVVKDRRRWELVGFTLAFWTATMVPGILNALSRTGSYDRGIFHTMMNLFVIIGFFIMLILYINVSGERTSFMAKLMGVTVAAFLVLFQFISFFMIRDKEMAYDGLRKRDSRLVLRESQYRPESLRYVSYISIRENGVRFSHQKGFQGLDADELEMDLLCSYVHSRIANLKKGGGDKFTELLWRVRYVMPPAFIGHLTYLMSLQKSGKFKDADAVERLLEELQENNKKLRKTTKKLNALAPALFRESAVQYMEKDKLLPLTYRKSIKALIKTSSKEGIDLRREVLLRIRPLEAPGVRVYRLSQKPAVDNYVAYRYWNKRNGRLYETGFSYLDFRGFVHPTAMTLLYILVAALVMILGGFRLFFYGALVAPLKRLLEGLKKVNEGHLDIRIPPGTPDEIGYLTTSFNGMVRSIRKDRAKLEEYAEGLGEKVRERTAALEESLEEVQKLKSQQDGDYFLTSLLIKQLGVNQAGGARVKVDFLVKQKKRFEFRKWKEELGGDLNKAHRIQLGDRYYTLFLNADAMGKSMQGAGGVLVLGSVLESLVERTRYTGAEHNQYPEAWLKNAFIELHNVFVSFHGSMLASLVMGLVDEITGILYYINAEHPFTVLLREQQARFIEKELTFRKIGTEGAEGHIFISILQLEPGDIIVAGSDGRDDLLMGFDEENNRILNYDENRFLEHVENSRGSLSEIYNSLIEFGELTDDLALLRIEYLGQKKDEYGETELTAIEELLKAGAVDVKNGNTEKALARLEEGLLVYHGHPELLRKALKIYVEKKEFDKAMPLIELYISRRPGDTRMIYYAGVIYRRLKEFQAAAEMGERVRLRDPDMFQNLYNLARDYLELKNFDRAAKMARNALNTAPDNEKALRLRSLIEELAPAEGD